MILGRLLGRSTDVHLERFRPSPWVLAIDPDTGAMRREFRFRTPRTSGTWDDVGDVRVALYRVGETLYFRAGDRWWALREGVSTRWSEGERGRKNFTLTVDGEVVLRLDYEVPVSSLEAEDPGFEEGRNDVLRAVHDLVSDPARWSERFRDEQRGR